MKNYKVTEETFPDNEWEDENEYEDEYEEEEEEEEYDEWDDHGFIDETDYWKWKGYQNKTARNPRRNK